MVITTSSDDPLDGNIGEVTRTKETETRKRLDVSKRSKQTQLTNGLRYNKGWPLQHHNFTMQTACGKLTIPKPTFERLAINSERDTHQLCETFETNKRVAVRADLPGSGKSHACWEMKQRDHKVLSVCPTRELKRKYGKDGVTLNTFFSVNFKYAIC